MVVRLRRNRNNGLLGEFRVSLHGPLGWRAACIEWRQILRRLIDDHLIVLERRLENSHGLHGEEARESDEQRASYHMTRARLEETAPRQPTVHKHIGPERRRCRLQFEARKLRRRDQVAQVLKEDSAP